MVTRDETMPSGRWAFDEAVTEAFDDMLERSIPAYNLMRELTTRLAISFVGSPGALVVDLGCSRGAGLRPIVEHFTLQGWEGMRFVGVDVAEPMLAAARATFARDPRVTIESWDLRQGYPPVDEYVGGFLGRATVSLLVLTLQFTPIEYRQRILSGIYDNTEPGGALIVVEKVLGEGARLHDVFDDEYLRFKRRSGYTDEQVARKKASLEGVLVSQTAGVNEAMLRSAGFRQVDSFYRWLNFAGWVAVK